MEKVCNKCGRRLNEGQPNGSQNIEINFNQYTSLLFDREIWNFTLCDNCLDQLAKSFIHPPKGFMEDPYKEYGEALQECINRGGLFE